MAAGVMATTAALGLGGGLGADHGDAAAAVVPALHVAPSESGGLTTPQSGVGQHGHQGQVKLRPLFGLLRRFEAPAALAGLDGGDIGGEGAGLALGLRKPPS